MTTTDPQDLERGTSPGPTTSAEVVRSEERLRVSTRTEVTGRVRVRKQVTSEEVTQTVTLRREELSVEELPPSGDGVGDGVDLGTAPAGMEDFEIILHEERLVVVTVPVERVRVRVHRSTDEVAVSEVLRREQIAFDIVPTVAE
jgi:stress response protein YsnF